MRELLIDGAKVAYDDAGAGEPVLLLHGYPQSRRAWRHQVPQLAQTHRVIAIDWPGWGDSERAMHLRHDYDAECARLNKILEGLDVERCNLVAHDYGGYLALGFVARHPGRVLRLALLNTRAHRTFPGAYFLLTALVGWLARAPLLGRILDIMPIGWIHRLGLRPFARRGCFDAALIRRYVGWLSQRTGRAWWRRFFADYQVAPRSELAAALPGIACPTAVIWGTEDPWCPLRTAEELARSIPGAQLTCISGGSHFIMEERPAEVQAALSALLARPAGVECRRPGDAGGPR